MAEEVNYNISKSMQFKKISLTKVITRTSARFEPTSTTFYYPKYQAFLTGEEVGGGEKQRSFSSLLHLYLLFFSLPLPPYLQKA